MGKLISLAEYAERIGCTQGNLAKRARRGMLEGAVKIGRNWCIDEDAKFTDHRIVSGKYLKKNSHKNRE